MWILGIEFRSLCVCVCVGRCVFWIKISQKVGRQAGRHSTIGLNVQPRNYHPWRTCDFVQHQPTCMMHLNTPIIKVLDLLWWLWFSFFWALLYPHVPLGVTCGTEVTNMWNWVWSKCQDVDLVTAQPRSIRLELHTKLHCCYRRKSWCLQCPLKPEKGIWLPGMEL